MQNIISECEKANTTLRSMTGRKKETLSDLIDEQIKKVEINSSLHAEQPYEDAIASAEKCFDIFNGIDKEIKNSALTQLESGIINTADHMGGICSPQSFQGDLLYAKMLERMGINIASVPIPATTAIPMCNCTNPRGAVLFQTSDSPYYLNFIPYREYNSIVKLCEPMKPQQVHLRIAEFKNKNLSKERMGDLIVELEKTYSRPEIFDCDGFCEQAKLMQYNLSKRMFPDKGPRLAYFEVEELAVSLINCDLKNKNSLLYYTLNDENIRNALCEQDENTGISFSSLLFRGIDKKRRLFSIDYTGKGRIVGKTRNNEEVDYSSDLNTLNELFRSNKICPGIGLALIVLFFSRGYTWLGGIFQTEYLPQMQSLFANALGRAGYYDLKKYIMSWKCDGYISGPIFMLSETVDEYLVNAGPFEFLLNNTSWEKVQDLLKTSIRDSHIMGMFEFYHDLISSKNKTEGWYERIAEYCKENYQNNKI